MFQYFMKIIPTSYDYLYGAPLISNQYSVTESVKVLFCCVIFAYFQYLVANSTEKGYPGAYFHYDLSQLW